MRRLSEKFYLLELVQNCSKVSLNKSIKNSNFMMRILCLHLQSKLKTFLVDNIKTFTTLKNLFFLFFFRILFSLFFVDIFTNNLALAMFDPFVELGMKPQFATAHPVDLILSSPVFLKGKALLNLLTQLN